MPFATRASRACGRPTGALVAPHFPDNSPDKEASQGILARGEMRLEAQSRSKVQVWARFRESAQSSYRRHFLRVETQWKTQCACRGPNQLNHLQVRRSIRGRLKLSEHV